MNSKTHFKQWLEVDSAGKKEVRVGMDEWEGGREMKEMRGEKGRREGGEKGMGVMESWIG